MPSPPPSPPLRVVQVSDTHLAPGVPFADAHWAAVLEHVAATSPDLVVHTGDVTLDGAADPAQLAYARSRLAELPVPWLAVPGNHDVGDVDDPRHPIDTGRRARWAEVFSTDHWSASVGGWRLVGADAQTLASDLPAAAAQAEWLAAELSRPGPTALFLHRPLRPWDGWADEPRRYLVEPLRSWLSGLFGDAVRLVGSGHVHQFLARCSGGVQHVWAPRRGRCCPTGTNRCSGPSAPAWSSTGCPRTAR